MSPAYGVPFAFEHFAKDQDFTGSENIGGQPVKGMPIQRQPQVGFFLRREAVDGGAIKGQVIGGFQQEFLVIVQHVQATFEVAKSTR